MYETAWSNLSSSSSSSSSLLLLFFSFFFSPSVCLFFLACLSRKRGPVFVLF